MVLRFRERAEAVKRRGFPPVEGPERQRFIEAANLDFQDFAMLATRRPRSKTASCDSKSTYDHRVLRTFLTLGRRTRARASENSAAPSLNVVSAFARSAGTAMAL